jgi:uncharacterized protein (TIGR03435 family)
MCVIIQAMEKRIVPGVRFARNTILSVAGIAGPALLVLVYITSAFAIRAQSRAPAKPGLPERPAFEVTSLKVNPECVGDHQDEKFSPGRVSVTCMTLRNLIQAAYGTFAAGPKAKPGRLRLLGAPEWAGSSRYNVTAKAPGDPPMDQMFGPMLQGLLEDRFQLKVHRETREFPVYTMTLAKGGLRIQQSKEGSCIPLDLSHSDQPSPDFCGRMTGRANGVHVTDDAYGMTMTEIASRFLANRLDRPVIDKTGREGLFDAHLEFARDNLPIGADNAGAPADTAAPSIFTAVQEQLGLKLSPDKGPVEVLVIDHVEKPSVN